MPALLPTRDRTSGEPGALSVAVRAAARFDRASISAPAGLLAAIPVVALLGGALAAGNRVAAATMGAGAMLVGIAWRVTGGRPPLALMATDAVVMAASTFIGGVTGSVTWVHLLVLGLWSYAAGLLVSVGPRGGVLGTQAIIAAVVFGRFSQPAPQALGLAGYVLVGGWTQVVFLSLVRWPRPLSAQRRATAAAYRELAALAAGPPSASTLPAAAALDDAQDALSGGALFADPALQTLRTLVNEGHRMRVQLSALQALQGRQGIAAPDVPRRPGGEVLDRSGAALELAARAIEGDRQALEPLSAIASEISARAAATPPGRLARRLTALAGQIRAVASLAPDAGAGGGLRSRRRQPRTSARLEQLLGDLESVRANISVQSPAGRHALRLALIVPLAELVAREVPLQRSYWMVLAAATVLRPEFGATFTRGTERAIGTTLGVALAGAIAVGLHPAGALTVLIVGLLAWAAYALFPASFAVGFAFITALVVFLLNAVSPDTLSTASARLLDTLVGGALGLIVYAAWPTWSALPARRALAELVTSQREYITAVLRAIAAASRARDRNIRPRARRARLARTAAEAAVARSLSEPVTRRIDADWSQSLLAATRRLVQAAHVIRLDVQEQPDRPPTPELAGLATALDRLLEIVETRLHAEPGTPAADGELPDLRSALGAVADDVPDTPDARALLAELDEIVDAANGLAALVGFDPAAEGADGPPGLTADGPPGLTADGADGGQPELRP